MKPRIGHICVALAGLLLLPLLPLARTDAAGTYAEGRVIVRLEKMEERGIFLTSFEGELVMAGYDPEEECDPDEYQCFTPREDHQDFSVRPENKTLITFLRNNLKRVMLIEYRIHRFKAMALSSEFEITGAQVWEENPLSSLPASVTGPKTGSERNFPIYGRILRLEYRGTMVGTWEGLYFDSQRRRVHPFSITDEAVAEYARKAMEASAQFYMGISESYVTGMRDSSLDIYEINYQRPPE
ncbi:MAG: hypothetical protein KDK30_04250 [Leptospiraceae bacterium]|nr:hypothetical protein [Leptospiraceae bacterium]MCB1314655.1 hypothetical protein [Leptospiraceae bacterium]